MTQLSIAFVIIALILWMTNAQESEALVFAKEQGNVSKLERCAFDMGPFWWTGGKMPVYYVEFKDGRKAYICLGLFKNEIEFEK